MEEKLTFAKKVDNKREYCDMVTMTDIQSDGEVITMICYVEGHKDDSFTLVLDAHTFDIIKSSAKTIDIYARQARNRLYFLYEENQALPREASSVWY